jgi:hypothetical protein
MFKRILGPLDGSPLAEAALAPATYKTSSIAGTPAVLAPDAAPQHREHSG